MFKKLNIIHYAFDLVHINQNYNQLFKLLFVIGKQFSKICLLQMTVLLRPD